MSRIGRLPVAIPAGVTVEVAENNVVTVKGPKGTLTRELPTEMEIKVEGEEVTVTRPNDLKKMKSLHGLTRTLINNMVVGVTEGYQKVLQLVVQIRPRGENQLSQDHFYNSLFSHHGKCNGEQVIARSLQHQ